MNVCVCVYVNTDVDMCVCVHSWRGAILCSY